MALAARAGWIARLRLIFGIKVKFFFGGRGPATARVAGGPRPPKKKLHFRLRQSTQGGQFFHPGTCRLSRIAVEDFARLSVF